MVAFFVARAGARARGAIRLVSPAGRRGYVVPTPLPPSRAQTKGLYIPSQAREGEKVI